MRLLLLTALTMIAFAANSVLNRIGVGLLEMEASAFAFWRTLAGAVALWLLVRRRGNRPSRPLARRLGGAAALALYMVGFSLAYRSLDAGLGALILFGALQLVLFGWALAQGEEVGARRWGGMALAFAGLVWLLWPSGAAVVPRTGAFSMLAAAVGWGIYTILGRAEADPLGVTASNFAWALPFVALPALPVLTGLPSPAALATALLAGAVTSGLGYALWYRVLPQLATSTAGIAQLSVPVIAILGGGALLGEAVTPRMWIAALAVLGGIALAVTPRRRT